MLPKILNVLVGLLAVPLMLGGLEFMLDPTGVVEQSGVDPTGIAGLSTMRGAIGGLLAGSSAMMIVGLVRRNTEWFLAVATLMVVASIGRIIGLAVDGVDPSAIRATVVEVVIAALLVAAHVKRGNR